MNRALEAGCFGHPGHSVWLAPLIAENVRLTVQHLRDHLQYQQPFERHTVAAWLDEVRGGVFFLGLEGACRVCRHAVEVLLADAPEAAERALEAAWLLDDVAVYLQEGLWPPDTPQFTALRRWGLETNVASQGTGWTRAMAARELYASLEELLAGSHETLELLAKQGSSSGRLAATAAQALTETRALCDALEHRSPALAWAIATLESLAAGGPAHLEDVATHLLEFECDLFDALLLGSDAVRARPRRRCDRETQRALGTAMAEDVRALRSGRLVHEETAATAWGDGTLERLAGALRFAEASDLAQRLMQIRSDDSLDGAAEVLAEADAFAQELVLLADGPRVCTAPGLSVERAQRGETLETAPSLDLSPEYEQAWFRTPPSARGAFHDFIGDRWEILTRPEEASFWLALRALEVALALLGLSAMAEAVSRSRAQERLTWEAAAVLKFLLVMHHRERPRSSPRLLLQWLSEELSRAHSALAKGDQTELHDRLQNLTDLLAEQGYAVERRL